jgi:hypothetical protein
LVEGLDKVAAIHQIDRGALNRSTLYERLSRPKGPRGVSDEAFEQVAAPSRRGGRKEVDAMSLGHIHDTKLSHVTRHLPLAHCPPRATLALGIKSPARPLQARAATES